MFCVRGRERARRERRHFVEEGGENLLQASCLCWWLSLLPLPNSAAPLAVDPARARKGCSQCGLTFSGTSSERDGSASRNELSVVVLLVEASVEMRVANKAGGCRDGVAGLDDDINLDCEGRVPVQSRVSLSFRGCWSLAVAWAWLRRRGPLGEKRHCIRTLK